MARYVDAAVHSYIVKIGTQHCNGLPSPTALSCSWVELHWVLAGDAPAEVAQLVFLFPLMSRPSREADIHLFIHA